MDWGYWDILGVSEGTLGVDRGALKTPGIYREALRGLVGGALGHTGGPREDWDVVGGLGWGHTGKLRHWGHWGALGETGGQLRHTAGGSGRSVTYCEGRGRIWGTLVGTRRDWGDTGSKVGAHWLPGGGGCGGVV